MCKRLFFSDVRVLYDDATQFETITTLPSVKEAQRLDLDLPSPL